LVLVGHNRRTCRREVDFLQVLTLFVLCVVCLFAVTQLGINGDMFDKKHRKPIAISAVLKAFCLKGI